MRGAPARRAVDFAVIGLGRIGLPLTQAATTAGIGVIGYDAGKRTVEGINAGRVPSGALAAADVHRTLAGGFRATCDPAVLGRVRTAVICAPTPLGEDRTLDLTAVAAADLTVLLQRHRTYDLQGLTVKAQSLLDARGATPAGVAARL